MENWVEIATYLKQSGVREKWEPYFQKYQDVFFDRVTYFVLGPQIETLIKEQLEKKCSDEEILMMIANNLPSPETLQEKTVAEVQHPVLSAVLLSSLNNNFLFYLPNMDNELFDFLREQGWTKRDFNEQIAKNLMEEINDICSLDYAKKMVLHAKTELSVEALKKCKEDLTKQEQRKNLAFKKGQGNRKCEMKIKNQKLV